MFTPFTWPHSYRKSQLASKLEQKPTVFSSLVEGELKAMADFVFFEFSLFTKSWENKTSFSHKSFGKIHFSLVTSQKRTLSTLLR